jgi:hypothetical protein
VSINEFSRRHACGVEGVDGALYQNHNNIYIYLFRSQREWRIDRNKLVFEDRCEF